MRVLVSGDIWNFAPLFVREFEREVNKIFDPLFLLCACRKHPTPFWVLGWFWSHYSLRISLSIPLPPRFGIPCLRYRLTVRPHLSPEKHNLASWRLVCRTCFRRTTHEQRTPCSLG